MTTDLIGQTIKITAPKLAADGASGVIRGYTDGTPFQVLVQVLEGSQKGDLGWLSLDDFTCPLKDETYPREMLQAGSR